MRIREGSQVKTGMAEEKETKGIDYQTWEFTGREYLEIAGISLGIAAAVNLLCYRAWWACIAVVPVGIVCFHTYRKNRIQRRKEELYDSFRDLIAWMHTALRSGYSMENAVLEAAGQLEQSLISEFWKEEDAVGVVEVILILVVLIGLVLIFKKQLVSLVNSLMEKVTNQSNTV